MRYLPGRTYTYYVHRMSCTGFSIISYLYQPFIALGFSYYVARGPLTVVIVGDWLMTSSVPRA